MTDEERARELTRRAILRVGAAVPLAVALGGIAAACGGGDDGSQSPGKGSTTSTVPGQIVPGGGPVHDDFSDGGTHTDTVHTDTPHGDTPHADGTPPPRQLHDDISHSDVGPFHNDGGYADNGNPDPANHIDNLHEDHSDHVDIPHVDSTVEVPSDHEDVAHVDTPHGDS